MVQVNRVYLKILFINRPQFLVDSNEAIYLITLTIHYGGVKKPLTRDWTQEACRDAKSFTAVPRKN